MAPPTPIGGNYTAIIPPTPIGEEPLQATIVENYATETSNSTAIVTTSNQVAIALDPLTVSFPCPTVSSEFDENMRTIINLQKQAQNTIKDFLEFLRTNDVIHYQNFINPFSSFDYDIFFNLKEIFNNFLINIKESHTICYMFSANFYNKCQNEKIDISPLILQNMNKLNRLNKLIDCLAESIMKFNKPTMSKDELRTQKFEEFNKEFIDKYDDDSINFVDYFAQVVNFLISKKTIIESFIRGITFAFAKNLIELNEREELFRKFKRNNNGTTMQILNSELASATATALSESALEGMFS